MAFRSGGEVVDDPNVDGGPNEFPYFFYVVEHEQGVVLFDSGAHPDLADRPAHRLGEEAAAAFDLRVAVGDDAVSQIARVGLAPQDVGHVVQSHLHYDHAGGLELFPHARAYVQAAELEAIADPPADQRLFYCAADYEQRIDWDVVDGRHDLFGDGRVVLLPTPGHTAGHQSLLVRLDAQAIILAADAAYLPAEFAERRVSSVYSDAAAMLASFELLAAVADEHDARLIFTHDLAWPQTLRVAPERWYD